MSIKLVSLNIEGKKHLEERILPFLKRESPDVVCLQEVFGSDVSLIERSLQMRGNFVPLARVKVDDLEEDSVTDLWGLLVLSRTRNDGGDFHYYGDPEVIPRYHFGMDPNLVNRAIVWVEFTHQGKLFRVATTHFTWSFDGEPSELQRTTLEALVSGLSNFSELVLVGDLNTPRGREIFDSLARIYKDNIPSEIVTTIDNDLHRASDEIRYVVDGVFSSPRYKISKVMLVDKLSDHMAVVCQIDRQNMFGRSAAAISIFLKRLLFFVRKTLLYIRRKMLRIGKKMLSVAGLYLNI